jgi:tetratricopeptide (TPR) repeat protein
VQQESIILFIDLETEAKKYSSTLASKGMKVASVSLAQAEAGITQGLPRAIIAPEVHTRAIATILKNSQLPLEIPFFTLGVVGMTSQPSLPREVTARLPVDIDAGVLCLRLSTVVAHPSVRRNLQPTLVGVGIEGKAPSIPPATSDSAVRSRSSRPPASMRSVPSAPKTSNFSAEATKPRTSRPPGSKPSAQAYVVPPPSVSEPTSKAERTSSSDSASLVVPGPTPSLSTASSRVSEPPSPPPSLASEPLAPPASLAKAEASGSSDLTTSVSDELAHGAPASAASTSSASSNKSEFSAAEALNRSASSEVAFVPPVVLVPAASAATAGASFGGDLVPLADSARPVTTSVASYAGVLDTDLEQLQGARAASKAKLIKVAAALFAATLLGGTAVALNGDKETPTAEKIPEGPVEKRPDAKDRAPAAAASATLPPDPKPMVEESQKTAGAGEEQPGSSISGDDDPEAKLYRIAAVVKGDSCEDVLEKPKEHYEKMVSWRGAQAWKLSRRALMKGDERAALNQMCQSAFIEPKGPATLGLARYYLGIRALDQAEQWAERAMEVNPKSKRSAQQLLGDILCQRGKMKEAREVWLSSFGLTSADDSRLLAAIGRFEKAARAARRGGDAPLAETHLRRAAAFDPKNAQTAADLASVFVQTGQPGLAKVWADKALDMDSASKVAKAVLSELSK